MKDMIEMIDMKDMIDMKNMKDMIDMIEMINIIIKNQYLANHFKDQNILFLLISFDYIYDTPLVLNNIYGSLNKDNLINIVINCTIDQAFLDLPKIKKLRIKQQLK